jgi:PAS domain S-box-containing protein
MKILVVEDDYSVARTLQLLLSSYGYAVDVAADGKTGLQLAETFDYDLILLDIGLPQLDGISICQQLRIQGVDTPILLLTGQGGGQQKAIALNTGADDYVVKPFDSAELVARVQALLRRGGANGQPILAWGNLSIDPSCCQVTYETHLLSLTPKEYAILEVLLRKPQNVFSAKAILDHAWSSVESPGEEAVRVHIKELRQKLTAVGAPKDLIKTLHRVGYRLNPMYSSSLATQREQFTVPQVAELKAVNEELRVALEQLRLTQTELRQKNQELKIAYQTIEQERQQLQIAHDTLEMRVAERTAELVRADCSSQQHQHQWRALFDHALDAIAIVDDNGCYVDANPAACELFGVSRAELLGSSITNLANLESDIAQIWQQFLQQGQMVGEFSLHRPDGTSRETEFTAIANFVPGRHLSILRDVSERKRNEAERKQAEESLRVREQQYHQILDSIADMVFVKEPGSRLVWANKAFRDYYGMTLDELQGTIDASFNEPDYTLQYVQDDACVFATGQLLEIPEEPVTRHDGVVRLFSTIKAPIYDERGQAIMLVGVCRDITDQKQADTNLRQREEFLSSIYNGADQGVFVVDVNATHDFHYGNFNRIAEQFAGFSAQEIQGKTPEEAFGAKIGATFRQNYDRCLQAGTSISYEEYVVFEHHTIWTLTTLSPLRDEHGAIYRIVGTAIDITDRKQLELSLQASQSKLSHILDSAIAAIASFRVFENWNWEYDYFSSGCEALFGYTVQELMADKTLWLSRVFPADREAVLIPLFNEFFAERNTTGEFRFYHKDGSIRWISSTHAAQKIADNCWQVTVVSHDITDRKLAEQKIQEQAALLDITSDAIIVRDLTDRILYWNQGAERLYGWPATDAIAQQTTELLQSRDCSRGSIMQQLLTQGEWRGEIHNVSKTGRDITVAARWTLVRNDTGQPKFVLSVDTDITEKKLLEAQFYRTQRLESLGTLSSGIAHDLNNVLTPILAISQLLRLNQPHLDARSQEMVQVLEDSARRGTNLIKQILTFARGTEGDPVPLQMVSLVREVVNVVQQTFPKSITLYDTSLDQLCWLVSADPTHLHQVLMNLCVNARDAMPQGGTLTLAVENYYVDPLFAHTNLDAKVGNYVVVTVADTGSGIPPNIHDRIFDPFFTTKQPSQGTGLGLSTVLGIVKSYGGFMQVVSEMGQGSQFKVYLPTTDTTTVPDQPIDEWPQGHGELVLIVDDDPAIRQANQSILESYHYKTLVAKDGAEAIALYTHHQTEIDIVLMDVMMPNVDGITVVRALQKMNPMVKIIALSGLPANRDPVLAAGATLFLPKPCNLGDLLQYLHSLINA